MKKEFCVKYKKGQLYTNVRFKEKDYLNNKQRVCIDAMKYHEAEGLDGFLHPGETISWNFSLHNTVDELINGLEFFLSELKNINRKKKS